MTDFYKGNIINTNSLLRYIYVLDLIYNEESECSVKLHDAFRKLTKDGSIENKIDLDRIIIDLYRPTPTKEKGLPIIYTKVVDQNGNEYGKESITGLLFPIKHEYSSFDITYTKERLKDLYFDMEKGCVYSKGEIKPNTFCLVDDHLLPELVIPQDDQNKLNNMQIGEERVISLNGKEVKLVCVIPSSIKVNMQPEMIFPSDKNVNYLITQESKANELEVHNYFEPYVKGLFKGKKKNDYYKLLYSLYLDNRLGDLSLLEGKEKVGPTYIKKIK